MNQKIAELIEKNPKIAKIILKKATTEEVLSIIKGLLVAKEYNFDMEYEGKAKTTNEELERKRREENIVSKSIKALRESVNEEELIEKIKVYHKYFDLLIEDKEKKDSGMIKWKEMHGHDWEINNFIKEYFSLLGELEKQTKGTEKQKDYDAFVAVLEGNLSKIQQVFSEVSSEGNSAFKEFEKKRTEKKGVVNEVVKKGYKKLESLSKANKKDLEKMYKELNLYSYEDAIKIVTTMAKKYKQEYFLTPIMAKMEFFLGKGKVKTDLMEIEIEKLINKTEVYPQYPYFPYVEKTEKEFIKRLKEDARKYNEDYLENFGLVIQLEEKIKKYRENYENDKKIEEEHRENKEKLMQKIKEMGNLKKHWFEEQGRVKYNQGEDSKCVKIKEKEYKIQDVYKILELKNYTMSNGISSYDNYILYKGRKAECRNEEKMNYEDMKGMMELYLLELKRKDKDEYKKKIKEIANWYPVSSVFDLETRSNLNPEVFIDVFKEYIEIRELNEKACKFIIGETALGWSSKWIELRKSILTIGEEKQKKLVRNVISKTEKEYGKYKIEKIIKIVEKETYLTKDSLITFLSEVKKEEWETLRDYVIASNPYLLGDRKAIDQSIIEKII